MIQRICLFAATAALVLVAPAALSAQSNIHRAAHPATVVRPGGIRAGMAAPPRESRARFHTPREGAGFGDVDFADEGFDGQGVGVVVGSFGHVRREEPRRRRCYEGAYSDAGPSAQSSPVQPQARQPVVTQPGYGGMAPVESSGDSRRCGGAGR